MQAKEDEQGVDAMWAWCKDWSATACTVVIPKALRIRMGVSRARSHEPNEVISEKPTVVIAETAGV